MNALKVFEFDGHQVRIVDRDGAPWWAAKDVCDAIGVDTANVNKAVESLDEDEKGRIIIPTPGGEQMMWAINEPGLYSLILRSRKPEAKRFKRWITHEVLPAIRKTGSYAMATAAPSAQLPADFMLGMAALIREEVDCRMQANRQFDVATVTPHDDVPYPLRGYIRRNMPRGKRFGEGDIPKIQAMATCYMECHSGRRPHHSGRSSSSELMFLGRDLDLVNQAIIDYSVRKIEGSDGQGRFWKA